MVECQLDAAMKGTHVAGRLDTQHMQTHVCPTHVCVTVQGARDDPPQDVELDIVGTSLESCPEVLHGRLFVCLGSL